MAKKKKHWTQTPEGKRKMSRRMKLQHKNGGLKPKNRSTNEQISTKEATATAVNQFSWRYRSWGYDPNTGVETLFNDQRIADELGALRLIADEAMSGSVMSRFLLERD